VHIFIETIVYDELMTMPIVGDECHWQIIWP